LTFFWLISTIEGPAAAGKERTMRARWAVAEEGTREVRAGGRNEAEVEAEMGKSWSDWVVGWVGRAEVEATDWRVESSARASWPVAERRTTCEGSVRGAAISLTRPST